MTLFEVLVVLTVISIILGMSVPPVRRALDAAATRAAVRDGVSTYGYARKLATARRTAVAVRIDTSLDRLVVHAGAETLFVRSMGERYGVRLHTTRDSMAFDPRGFGYGAANLSLIFGRGMAAETLFVARLGRVRR
jgi:type II secretory pathway pseudopilin PulG